MAQEMVQISQAQMMNMMGFQKQYIEEKEKKMLAEDELKKSNLENQEHKKKYAELKRKARVWLNKSEEAKKMEEEHTQVIQTIQNESKSKVMKLESQVEEMREKIQLGTSNSTVLSELLADSEKKITTIESDLKLTKKSNEDLQKEISALTEGKSLLTQQLEESSKKVTELDDLLKNTPKSESPELKEKLESYQLIISEKEKLIEENEENFKIKLESEQSKIVNLEKKINDSEIEIQRLNDVITTTANSDNDKGEDSTSSLIIKYESQIKEMIEKNKKQNDDYEQEIKKLNDQIIESNKNQKKDDELNSLLEKAKTENKKLKEDYQKLEEDSNRNKAEFNDYQKKKEGENEKLVQTISALEQSQKEKVDELGKLNTKMGDTEGEYKTKCENLERKLAESQKVAEKLNSDLAQKNSELDGKNKAHLETLTSNNTKASDLEKQISSLTNKVKLLEKSKETLQGMVSSMADEKMEFENENENIKKQYEEVKGVCTQLEEQAVAFKQQIQKLVQTNDIYEIDSKKMKQSLDASTSLIKRLEEQTSTMNELLSEVTNLRIIKAQKEECDSRIDSLVQELAKEKETVANLSSQLEKVQLELSNITKIKEELEANNTEQSKLIDSLNEEKTEQNEKIELLTEKERRLVEVEEEVNSLNESLKKSESALKEKTMEHRIGDKQNQQIIKQLQNQLKLVTGGPLELSDVKRGASMINLRSSKMMDSDNESAEESSSQQSPRGDFKKINRAETTGQLNSRHSSPRSSTRNTANTNSNNNNNSNHNSLSESQGDKNGEAKLWENDFSALLIKFGKLQEENFGLSSQINRYKGEIKQYKEDSEKKSKVIQSQAKSLQVQGRSTMEMDMAKMQRDKIEKQNGGLLGVFGSILGGTVQEEIDTQKEVNNKMTSVLEQTLLKNVSLQDDLDTMGNEILTLNEKNTALEEEVKRLTSMLNQ